MEKYECYTLISLGLFIMLCWVINCFTIKADGTYLLATIGTIAGLFTYGIGRIYEKRKTK
jgi:hypothetical protein